jgi:hypothetical protein
MFLFFILFLSIFYKNIKIKIKIRGKDAKKKKKSFDSFSDIACVFA